MASAAGQRPQLGGTVCNGGEEERERGRAMAGRWLRQGGGVHGGVEEEQGGGASAVGWGIHGRVEE